MGRLALRAQAGPVQAVWLRSALAGAGLRPPTQRRLQEMLRQLVDSDGPYAQIRHDGGWVRRYRDRILIEPAGRPGPRPRRPRVCSWPGGVETAIDLPQWGGTLRFVPASGDEPGIARERLLGLALEIGPLAMSASLRLRADAGSRPIRKHCQAIGMPAWEPPPPADAAGAGPGALCRWAGHGCRLVRAHGG
ncbi:MAG: TilS substrate-binding domain-containing protein [Burkholderiaceae bacterium]